jgi:hypothetical protein
MALVRKGSRLIAVDGVVYRWRIRGRPTYGQGLGWRPLAYAVERAEKPAGTLLVLTDRPHPGNWVGLPSNAVVPGDVAQAIRRARERGWEPDRAGPPFRLGRA